MPTVLIQRVHLPSSAAAGHGTDGAGAPFVPTVLIQKVHPPSSAAVGHGHGSAGAGAGAGGRGSAGAGAASVTWELVAAGDSFAAVRWPLRWRTEATTGSVGHKHWCCGMLS